MKVFAIITLAQPLSRSGSDRWGPFLRAHGEKEHLWQGRKLTPEEFNTEFPKALRFAGPDRPLVGRILVEPDAGGEGDSIDPVDAPPTLLVSEHEAKIAEIQAGVDAWVAEQNQKLVDAGARIAELESTLALHEAAATNVATPHEGEETNPEEPRGPSEGSEPVPAGAQSPVQPAASETDKVDPVDATAPAPVPAKKGKKAK